MPLSVKESGAWHSAIKVSGKVGGTWTDMKFGHENVAGTWRMFYSGAYLTASCYISYQNTDCCSTYDVTVNWVPVGTNDTDFTVTILWKEDSGSYTTITTDQAPSTGAFVHSRINRKGPTGTSHTQWYRVQLLYKGSVITDFTINATGSYTTPCTCS